MTSSPPPVPTSLGRTARQRPVAAWLSCAAVLIGGCGGTGPTTVLDDPAPELATATVVRQDLVTRDAHRGTLGYGVAAPLVAASDGTVTALPEADAVIGRGEVVAEIDGVPMRLLYGDRPAWRRFSVSETAADHGPDVRQLNDNLAALGYAAREDLPGERFDWRSREAVRRWQEAVDRPATGVLDLGEVAFVPDVIRVSEVVSHLGARVGAGQIIAMATDTEVLVTLELDAVDRGTWSADRPVTVVLPDRREVPATVRSIGRIATTPEGSEDPATIPITIAFIEDLRDDFALDAVSVNVEADRVLVEDVLVVPVGALVALRGGGYAVERVTAGGITEQVAVQPGEFADGSVAVSGGLVAGDEVVVPS